MSAIFVDSAANTCACNPSTDSKNGLKHFFIDSVRANYKRHKKEYGKMIIATDSISWRYDIFPEYKYARKMKRKADKTCKINWDFVNEVSEELISDLSTHFPMYTIKVPRTEGDDIIGVLTKYLSEQNEPVLIQANDHDNYQLHKYKGVRQWSTTDKKYIKPDNPHKALIEKIVKGETSDGIPNYKMPNDTFVTGTRQKSVYEKELNEFFIAENPLDVCKTDVEKQQYIRNEMLVSYEKIPLDIQENIIMEYNNQLNKKHSKMGLMNYLMKNQMNNILDAIHDFY